MRTAIRPSRTIRTRIAKHKGPRLPRTIEFTRTGVNIDGDTLPYWIGTDVDIIEHHNSPAPLAEVQLTVLTEHVTITDVPRHAHLTVHHVG